MNFGEKLKQLRQSRNWSQPELSEAIGIEQSYLSKLENDKSIPSAEMLNRILAALNISIDELLTDIDDAEISNQLNSIPLVHAHTQQKEVIAARNSNRWLIVSTICVALGFSFMVAGATALLFPETTFNYQSQEIVPRGDNGEAFDSLDRYLEYRFAPVESEMLTNHATSSEIELARNLLHLEHINLNSRAFVLSYDNQGIAYTTDLDSDLDQQILSASDISNGATRTFRLQQNLASPQIQRRAVNGVLMSSGIFLLMIGWFGFFIRIFQFFAVYLPSRRKS